MLVLRRGLDRHRLLLLAGYGALATVAVALSFKPTISRWVFALLVAGLFVCMTLRWPRASAVTVLSALPFLALVRRLLIPVSAWTSFDPLVLLGPAAAAVLLMRLRVRGAAGRTSALTVATGIFLAVALLEVANPSGGGIKAGAAGLLFVAAPVIWFFVGREAATEDALEAALRALLVISVAVGLYGLAQTFVGFPPWDRAWLDWVQTNGGGLQAFQVGGQVRAFASFSSFAEYSTYLSAGVVVAVAMAARGRRTALLALPVLVPALFLASARGPLVLTVAGCILVLALAWGRLLAGLAALVVTLLLLPVAVQVLFPAGSDAGGLVSHQVSGLTNPLDAKSSTLRLHVAVIVAGLQQGVRQPLGLGTAATNLAGQKLGGGAYVTSARAQYAETNGLSAGQNGTEFDISDAFLGLGAAGGFAYLFMIAATLLTVGGLARRTGGVPWLGGVGLLVVVFGHWLNGGFYALTPLLWFAVGGADRARTRSALAAARMPQRAPAGGRRRGGGTQRLPHDERGPASRTQSPRAERISGNGRVARRRPGSSGGRRRPVLFLNHTSRVSGGELALIEQVECLRERFEAVVASPPGALEELARERDVPWVEVPEVRANLAWRAGPTLRALADLTRHGEAAAALARESGAGVIYANTIRSALAVSMWPAARPIPLIGAIHDCLPDGLASRTIRRRVTNRARLLVANSRHTAERWGLRPGPGRLRVVYPGPDVEYFSGAGDRALARHQLGLDPEAPLLVQVGQITPWKGQDVSLMALARIQRVRPDARLVLIGDITFDSDTRLDNGSYRQQLEQTVRQEGLQDAVTFAGWVDDPRAHLAAADVVLQPSWEEPFGRAVVEAMAAGRAVLSTEVGGPAEIVRPGVDGILLPPDAPRAWAEAALDLLHDRRRRESMELSAAERAEAFSLGVAVEQLDAAIAEVSFAGARR